MTIILIGRNDAEALGGGWHPVQEGPAGVPCRWMSPRAVVRLPGLGLRGVSVTVSAPWTIHGRRPGLSIYAGERRLGHCADLGEEGAWNVAQINFNIPEQISDAWGAAEKLELTLVIEELSGGIATPLAFIPHEMMGNGDLRELGTLVSSIRGLTPA